MVFAVGAQAFVDFDERRVPAEAGWEQRVDVGIVLAPSHTPELPSSHLWTELVGLHHPAQHDHKAFDRFGAGPLPLRPEFPSDTALLHLPAMPLEVAPDRQTRRRFRRQSRCSCKFALDQSEGRVFDAIVKFGIRQEEGS